jgi:hypothetical protein
MHSRKPAQEGQASPAVTHEPSEGDGLPGCAANYAILDQLLGTCCQELMRDYGLAATFHADLGASEPATVLAVGTIDFVGPDLRGTIGLRMTRSVVEQTYYAALGAEIEAGSMEGRDWTCELVNQLMGRLKNKLRAFRISFDMNSPKVSETAASGNLKGTLRHRFLCERGKFTGYLDVVVAPGVLLAAQEPHEPLPEEGDLLLF